MSYLRQLSSCWRSVQVQLVKYLFISRGKNRKIDSVQNVRKFFQGQLWARMVAYPDCPICFMEIKSAFEELYHQLEPHMLGLEAFEAGPCHRMNVSISFASLVGSL